MLITKHSGNQAWFQFRRNEEVEIDLVPGLGIPGIFKDRATICRRLLKINEKLY
jgi:hypothetical protein